MQDLRQKIKFKTIKKLKLITTAASGAVQWRATTYNMIVSQKNNSIYYVEIRLKNEAEASVKNVNIYYDGTLETD